MKLKAKKLAEQLKPIKNLLIFTHNNPDPDTIASAYILSVIAAKFQTRCTIVYGGQLNRAENLRMVELMSIPMKPIEKLNPEIIAKSAIALVDCQKGNSNHSLPSEKTVRFTFDHHPSTQHRSQFSHIDTKASATACILMDYFFQFKLNISKMIATSYCYAVLSETMDLARGTRKRDVRQFYSVYPSIDPNLLGKIRHAKKNREYIQIFKRLLNRMKINGKVAYCDLGRVRLNDYLSEFADFLLKIEDIEYSLVTGVIHGKNFFSVRGDNSKTDLGHIVRALTKNQGQAGGHEQMAAGFFEIEREDFIQRFISTLQK